ncbi:MAG: site-specific integrase [Planctomycetia bacterium]|nr:site-specific integrase [Planctomycetia bacterium]
MNKLLKDYITFLRIEKNLSPNTIEAYERDLKRYLHFLETDEGFTDLNKIKQKHIRKYIRLLTDVHLSITSINRAFSSIRSFHNYLSGEEIIRLYVPTLYYCWIRPKLLANYLLFYHHRRLIIF